MAWKQDYRLIIDLLEDGVATILYVRGYLETKASQGDVVASNCAGQMQTLQRQYTQIRQQYLKQGRLFYETKDKDDDGT